MSETGFKSLSITVGWLALGACESASESPLKSSREGGVAADDAAG